VLHVVNTPICGTKVLCSKILTIADKHLRNKKITRHHPKRLVAFEMLQTLGVSTAKNSLKLVFIVNDTLLQVVYKEKTKLNPWVGE